MRRVIGGCDLVFHCAALVREAGSWNEFFLTNIKETKNILRVSNNTGIKRFIHFSSVAAYGMNPPENADETIPHQPCGDLYCNTKIASEKAVWAAHHETKLPVIVIQPRQCLWSIFQAMVERNGISS